MSNNKVEATFHPDVKPMNVEELSESMTQIIRFLRSNQFKIAMRKLTRVFKNINWDLRNGKVTDEERLALAWVRMHREEGRMDLVEEDLLWLGRRLEEKA